MQPGGSMALELCRSCFTLRHVASNLYVAAGPLAAATNGTRVTRLAEHSSHFWRVRGGTYGWPGSPTENYIRWDTLDGCYLLRGDSGETSLSPCPPQETSGATWPAAPPARCEEPGCEPLRWLAEAPEADLTHVVTLHTCSAGGCANRTGLANGDRLEVACKPCPTNSPTAISGVGVWLVVALVVLMVAPVVVMCVLRRHWHTGRQEEQWPQRRRPLLVLVVFQVSWTLAVFAPTPQILWE